MATQNEVLQQEIDKERAYIRTDDFKISIGELASMYKEGELFIHPEFQRYFRWDDDRKSKFIESIFLGIPIPSIFVSQQPSGIWDVVDGLQRLSTIFQLMGILRDEEQKLIPPLRLAQTKYLPSLDGLIWEDKDDSSAKQLSPAQRLFFKRSTLDVKIILRESSEKTKFELFQRLNTGGASLSEQEIRNAMLIAANQPFYAWIKKLASFEPFVETVSLTDRVQDEQFDKELVLRFLVFRTLDETGLKSIRDLNDFLTDRMMELSPTFDSFKDLEEQAFYRTFELVRRTVGTDAFKKYDVSKKRFLGGFSLSGYEIVAFGLGFNIDVAENLTSTQLLAKIQQIWENPVFVSSSGSGIRASSRIPKTIPLGRSILKP